MFAPSTIVSTESMNPIRLFWKGLSVTASSNGSPDTKLSPPSSSAAMLSTVTHCWTIELAHLSHFLDLLVCGGGRLENDLTRVQL